MDFYIINSTILSLFTCPGFNPFISVDGLFMLSSFYYDPVFTPYMYLLNSRFLYPMQSVSAMLFYIDAGWPLTSSEFYDYYMLKFCMSPTALTNSSEVWLSDLWFGFIQVLSYVTGFDLSSQLGSGSYLFLFIIIFCSFILQYVLFIFKSRFYSKNNLDFFQDFVCVLFFVILIMFFLMYFMEPLDIIVVIFLYFEFGILFFFYQRSLFVRRLIQLSLCLIVFILLVVSIVGGYIALSSFIYMLL